MEEDPRRQSWPARDGWIVGVRFLRYDHKARGHNAGNGGIGDHEAEGEWWWCLILS
jgi:hypothetical protein